MGLLQLKALTRRGHDQGGETMTIEMNDTQIHIEYSADEKDIRISDGSEIVKIRLDDDCSIRDVLQNDRFVSPE